MWCLKYNNCVPYSYGLSLSIALNWMSGESNLAQMQYTGRMEIIKLTYVKQQNVVLPITFVAIYALFRVKYVLLKLCMCKKKSCIFPCLV